MGQAVTVFDLDDFAVDNHGGGLLDRLRDTVPGLKVTLFVVPFPLDKGYPHDAVWEWLAAYLRKRPWVQYALHGFHHTYLECKAWDKARTLEALRWAEDSGIFVRGFKGPYWAMAPGVYEALLERGWWVADHPENNAMRPAALRCHLLGTPNIVHGHVQDIGTNGLREAWGRYTTMAGPFEFIDEVMRHG